MKKKSTYTPHNRTSSDQHSVRKQLYKLFDERPLPDDELLINLGLYNRSSAMAKILFLDEIYRRIIPVPGVIMVFGTWWGQDVVALHNLRAVHEPYNALRKVIGFDTFTGYPGLTDKDRASDTIKPGSYHTSKDYVTYLDELLTYHNKENSMGHVCKHELVVGDVTKTLEKYLKQHPETLIAMAYLDLVLYEPTKRVLELIKPYMVKGAVLAMDELNSPEYPGETAAFREVFDISKLQTQRSMILPDRSFSII